VTGYPGIGLPYQTDLVPAADESSADKAKFVPGNRLQLFPNVQLRDSVPGVAPSLKSRPSDSMLPGTGVPVSIRH